MDRQIGAIETDQAPGRGGHQGLDVVADADLGGVGGEDAEDQDGRQEAEEGVLARTDGRSAGRGRTGCCCRRRHRSSSSDYSPMLLLRIRLLDYARIATTADTLYVAS